MTSKAIGLRISQDLYDRVTAFGLENYPKGDTFDISKTLHALLDKGLTANGVRQPANNNVQQKLDSVLDEKLDNKLNSVLDEKLDNKLDSVLDEKLDNKLDNVLDEKLDSKLDDFRNEILSFLGK